MTARLRPVPDNPPRVLGLVRVSKERDGMISPEVQRVAISDYSASRGYVVAGWAEGLDESGSRARSAWWPKLDQAVAEVEAGEYDVIVVWKFSRTARHRLRWAVALDRVEEAGGRLESATEQVDTTTSTGRFTRGMLAELNAFEAERIGEVWKEVHGRRTSTGRPHTGKPKWGYTYDLVAKVHRPDAVLGPVLAGMYRRYVAGESVYQLVRWLNQQGWRTTQGGLWSDRSLRRVLDSGFASGRFMVAGALRHGVHEALIDEGTWVAYLDARARRRRQPARSVRSQYLLSGLVRCARCQGSMVAGQFGDAREPKYRCKAGKENGPEACAGGYVLAAYLEREVLVWLQQRAGRLDAARLAKATARTAIAATRSEETRLAREVGRVEKAMQRLALQDAKEPLPPVIYAQARDELRVEHTALVQALEDMQRHHRDQVVDPSAAARALLVGWDTRPVEHRREGLRQLVARVEVLTGRHVHPDGGRPRAVVTIVPTWGGA